MMAMLMSAVALALQVTAAGPALDGAEALEQLRMCVALPDNRAVDACRAALKRGLTPSRAAKANAFLAEALWSRIEPEDRVTTLARAAEAERACREAIALDPDQPLAFYLLGHLLLRKDEPDAAKIAYERAVRLRPAWTTVSLDTAQLLESQKLDAERTAVLKRAADADSGDARARRRLGEAATAGLLLGEAGLDGVRTLWITINSDRAFISEVPDDIVVPRPDGFWLARVVHPTDNQMPQDRLWVRRLGSTARPPRVRRRSVRMGEHDENGCTDEHVGTTITFVMPAYLGVNVDLESECNGRVNVGRGPQVFRVSSQPMRADQPSVSIEEIAGAAGATALEEGAARAITEAKERDELGRDYEVDHGRHEWTVARERGQWFLRGNLPYQRGGPDRGFALRVDVPRSVVRQDPLFPSWDIVKDLVPDAVDAFSSPRHDALVVLTSDRLLVYSVRDGKVAAQLLVRDRAAGTPVMVEWAVDRHVARWTSAVRRLSLRPR